VKADLDPIGHDLGKLRRDRRGDDHYPSTADPLTGPNRWAGLGLWLDAGSDKSPVLLWEPALRPKPSRNCVIGTDTG